MSNYISTLICLFIFMLVQSFMVVTNVYEEEQAAVRNIHSQVIKEMAAEGYLDSSVAMFYEQALLKEGFQKNGGPFFRATRTSSSNRAIKPMYGIVVPSQNFVELETRVRPSFSTQLVNWLQTGEGDIVMRNTRESQYMTN